MAADDYKTNRLVVAMAADSLIYAPLYWAARKINNSRYWRFKIEFDHGPTASGYGDFGAYAQVRTHSADLCVCDPMVVLADADQKRGRAEESKTAGAVVAILVQRPALWLVGVDGSPLAAALKAGDEITVGSVAQRAKTRQPAELGRVFSYDDGSSASYYFEELLSQNCFRVTTTVRGPMGSERRFLRATGGAANGTPECPDVVLTCEVADVYRYRSRLQAKHGEAINPIIFAWHRWTADILPFTSLVASREMLRSDERQSVIELLRVLQSALQHVRQSSRTKEFVAAYMSRGSTVEVAGATDDLEAALTQLRTGGRELFPTTVRPEDVPDASWDRACMQTWRIANNSTVAAELRASAIEPAVAAQAAPKTWRERCRSLATALWTEAQDVDMTKAAVVSPVLVTLFSIAMKWLRDNERVGLWSDATQYAGAESLLVLLVNAIVIGLAVTRRRRQYDGLTELN